MILLVSEPRDLHLRALRAALRRRGARTALLDLGRYPRPDPVTLRLGGAEAPGPLLLGRGRGRIDLREATAVWWRRERPPTVDLGMPLPAHRAFAARETTAALRGAIEGLPARLVDRPSAVEAMAPKLLQLRLAAEAGLAVPRTCATSDPREARAFLAELGAAGAIHKPLAGGLELRRETRAVGPAERRLLPLLRLAPTILQERIRGLDLRVTAVGGRLFPAALELPGGGESTDFRPRIDEARILPAALPREVAAGLRRLLRTVGLSFAAVDLRRTPDGACHFLEVNARPQWLFVEERTGQPITEALAGLLAEGDPGA